MPGDWWLKNSHYVMYMIRELTAVFAAIWIVGFMLTLPTLKHAPALWAAQMQSPKWLIFSVIAFIFVMYHSWTSFTATGTLMYLRPGKKAIPASTLNGSMFIAWLVASIIIGAILIFPLPLLG